MKFDIMKIILKSYSHTLALFISSILLVSCGIVNGGPTGSEGEEAISADASIASFDANTAEELFKSVPYKNTTANKITLYKIDFINNSCNSFSFYGVNDDNGNILIGPSDNINYTFQPGKRVQAIIRFKSEPCAISNYTTTVVLYFRDVQNRTFSSSTILQVKGDAPAGSGSGNSNCDQESIVDTTDLIEDRRFGIPADGNHYLRVDGMRAFIYPPESEDYRTVIGTDIGDVDPTAFIQPYLTLRVSDKTATSANFTLDEITPCTDFSIPSALTDAFFLGSPTLLTTNKAFDGTINLTNTGKGFREVNMEIQDFRVQLLAENVGDATPQIDKSIIVDPVTKTFRIGMKTNLSTKKTAADATLVDKFPGATNAIDEEGNPVLNLTTPVSGKSALQGDPLVDSHLMLVGVGIFDNSENDFIGDTGTAKQFLIDNKAYLYVQIKATLMCSTTEAGCE